MRGEDIFSNLNLFFSQYQDNPAVAALTRTFRSLSNDRPDMVPGGPETLRLIYEEALRITEGDAADKGFGEETLGLQRELYRELEQVLSLRTKGGRHHFLIVIPVADRPLMLKNCLASLVAQCQTFRYGGLFSDSDERPVYDKISVFIVDDSKDGQNIHKIKEISAEMNSAGISTLYVGLKEQTEILGKVLPAFREKLPSLITGNFAGEVKPHKGASLTRNIAYLYIKSRLDEFPEKTLIWFLDSDEEFMIKVSKGGRGADIPFINYFYWLDRIFTVSDAEVLTGKVVGDPPVTPAVMINTFLDDIIMFFDSLSGTDRHSQCPFHGGHEPGAFSAEYHDMGGLFGYALPSAGKKYLCGMTGHHSAEDCLRFFSDQALGFFYGLHPTRTQFYRHKDSFTESENARTVYTGNYILTPGGLRHFIPFAALGLRMAGPTLGRILRRRLGNKFISANLPLLHKRTITDKYTDEFRSGIVKGKDTLDLSAEFQRQFWGDVMLFSVEALTEKGYPEGTLDTSEIGDTVRTVQDKIWKMYTEHQAAVSEKLRKIRAYLSDQHYWWNRGPAEKSSVWNFLSFCSFAEKNFGPDSAIMGKISGEIAEASFTKIITGAIYAFYDEDRSWHELLESFVVRSHID